MISPNTLVILLGTMALGICCGLVGALMLLRRRALLSDALAHATLPGIGIAFLLSGSRSPLILGLGALCSALLGAALVSWLPRFSRVRRDAATACILGIFFGAGIALSAIIQRSGPGAAAAGLDGLLLGRTAGMLRSEVMMLGGAALVMSILIIVLRKEILLSCFDPLFGRCSGQSMGALDLLQTSLLAITIVLALPAVGVVLTAALVVIPPAAARFWTDRFDSLLRISALLGAASGLAGTIISSSHPELPAGPVIVLSASSFFTFSLLLAPKRGIIARVMRKSHRKKKREVRRILHALLLASDHNLDSPSADQILAGSTAVSPRGLNLAIREELIELKNDQLRLTELGKNRALKARRSQEIWREWLTSEAAIDRDLIDLDEEDIEKLLSPELIHSLEKSIGLRELSR
ncbi:MAG: metal ABC transporter permease [Planctomycetota bacterium]